MPSVCDQPISKKEVIRFKAKKYDGYTRPEAKTFSADPDLTTFSTLRELLIKAFDIKGDFVISYLVRGHKGADDRYLPMLSEWDLNTAVYGASDPHVVLKVDLKPFETTGLDEWDIIDEDDVARVAATSTSIFGSTLPTVQQIFGTSSNNENEAKKNGRRSWFFGGRNDNGTTTSNSNNSLSVGSINGKKSTSKGPMTDAEFRSYLDAEGRLLHANSFRAAVYRAGLEPSLRPVVWRHLLSIYPEGMSGEERISYTKRLADKYYCLKESWQRRLRQYFIGEELRLVANAVRKDVIRTDRTHPFFAGDEDRNKNLMALFSLLTTYAMAHPEVSYCQGMSDLASPLLVVMKDEAQAYICFCALMRRLRQNFSCDGWAMTRKFQHLSELLQYYDPTFYEYLREMHADDLLFAYRWLLLELKREFSFDDALNLMEVMWASLPSTPPARGCDLDLYDVDLTAYEDALAPLHSLSSWSSPAGSGCTLLSPLQLQQQSQSVEDGGAEMEANGAFDLDGGDVDCVGDGGVDISMASRSAARPVRQSSVTSTHSCPGSMGCVGGVCPALVVRSLMLNHKENSRLHALRHASYPPKLQAGFMDEIQSKNDGELFSLGCWTDELQNHIPEIGTTAANPSAGISIDTSHQQPPSEISITVGNGALRNGPTNSFDSNLQSMRRNSDASCLRSYVVRPSTEMKVTDKEKDKSEASVAEISPRQVLPALIATEAGSETDLNGDTRDNLEKRDLTLTDIQEICLSHVPLEDSSPGNWNEGVASKTSSNDANRSREPSGNQSQQTSSTLPTATAPLLTSSVSIQAAKSRHASSSAASYIVTNLDSGYSDGNNTALTRSLDFASRASTTASTDPQNVADVADFISVDRDPRVLLPAPHEFGDGNPFMLFVCLTLLLQHRDHIMKNQMDFNEIAIYFDKLMRKHNASKVLKRARVLFSDYLRTGWFDNSSTITRSASSPGASKFNGDGGRNGQKSNYWSFF